MLFDLGLLLLFGTLAATAIRWLAGRPHPLAHAAGMLSGLAVTGFCGFVAFALIADDLGIPPRLPGALSTASFAAVAAAAAIGALHGSAARRRRSEGSGVRGARAR